MAPGEIRRFVERFGLTNLLDVDSAAYVNAGLKYLKLSETELLGKLEQEPRLLRLPLVRSANFLAVGHDENTWKAMLGSGK